MSRKILSIGAISSIFERKIQIYVLLNSVITNVVAFIVVIEMALSGISYNCSIFPKKLSLPAEKKFSSATLGAIIFHIRSN